MRYTMLIGTMLVLIMGCGKVTQHSLAPVQIGDDSWNDIATRADDIYVTNYDGMEGPGDRVFLYRLDSTGAIQDSINLGMNGQGYMSIAADMGHFYLVDQLYGNRFKVGFDGQIEQMSNSEPELNGWEQGGIAYDSVHDSLYVLLWKSTDSGHLRMYTIDRQSMRLRSYRELEFPGGYDYFAMTFDENPFSATFYILCRHEDEGNAVLLLHYFPSTGLLYRIGLLQDNIRGIAFKDGQLIGSTPDRQIELLQYLDNRPTP
jgi:hypothetical protein